MTGNCPSVIQLADDQQDNFATFRCQNWPSHKGRHHWSGKCPLTVIDQLKGEVPKVINITWQDWKEANREQAAD